MTGVYLIAATAGLAWAALSLLLGHLGHGAGAGGHDFDTGGAGHFDSGGAGHADAGGHSGDSGHAPDQGLPLLSPTVITSYIAGFGFAGLLVHEAFGVESALFHVPLALLGGTGLGVSMAWVLKRLVRDQETTSSAPVSDFVGLEATVTTPIAAGGFGEIAFEHNGTRFCGAARALDGEPHPRGEDVLIAEVSPDGSYRVERVGPGGGRRPVRVAGQLPT